MVRTSGGNDSKEEVLYQEHILSKEELIDSMQHHFAVRIGGVDWNNTQEYGVAFTPFTLFPEEVEDLFVRVGHHTGRYGVAIILNAMKLTAAQLREQSKQRQTLPFTQDEIVALFKEDLDDCVTRCLTDGEIDKCKVTALCTRLCEQLSAQWESNRKRQAEQWRQTRRRAHQEERYGEYVCQ